MKISKIFGREIFDSRGTPTLEVTCVLDNGAITVASVPSGAFATKYEAVPTKTVAIAIRNIENVVSPSIINQDPANLVDLDNLLISMDGSTNKQNLGANTTLGVSIALARAGALATGKSLVEYLRFIYQLNPTNNNISPMFNIVNGGAHADNNLSFQEFMIVPQNENLRFKEKMDQGVKVFNVLRDRLDQLNKSTNVGDEGGFAPELNSNEEAVIILIEEAGYKPLQDIAIALDIAAGGIPDLSIATYPKTPIDYYKALVERYPVVSLEDPFTDDNWSDWATLTSAVGGKVTIVGDDLFTTNTERLKLGIEQKAANAISIKPNQIGTISETINAIKIAHKNNIEYQISHRSGETEDTFISDLAIACGAKYIKAGAPNRGERIAKYNQIIRLEEKFS